MMERRSASWLCQLGQGLFEERLDRGVRRLLADRGNRTTGLDRFEAHRYEQSGHLTEIGTRSLDTDCGRRALRRHRGWKGRKIQLVFEFQKKSIDRALPNPRDAFEAGLVLGSDSTCKRSRVHRRQDRKGELRADIAHCQEGSKGRTVWTVLEGVENECIFAGVGMDVKFDRLGRLGETREAAERHKTLVADAVHVDDARTVNAPISDDPS